MTNDACNTKSLGDAEFPIAFFLSCMTLGVFFLGLLFLLGYFLPPQDTQLLTNYGDWRTMDVVPFCKDHGFQDGYITMDIGERPRTPYIECYLRRADGHHMQRYEIADTRYVINASSR